MVLLNKSRRKRKNNTSIATATSTTSATGSIVAFTLVAMLLLLLSTITTPFGNALTLTSNATTNDAAVGNNNKVVLLAFYDNPKSQFENAKPILDQYGFKATFFVVCNWLGQPDRMTWQDVAALQNDGQDIESHSMNHRNIDHLSAADLDFEVGQSKKCLADHGINSTIFGSPHGNGQDNSTVINTIAKYYEFGRLGYAPLMFLHCDGYTKDSSQTDCRTYFDNGTLTFANRYSIREWSHTNIDKKLLFDNNKIFDAFVREVNVLPAKFNSNSSNNNIINGTATTTLKAVPIISYHSIENINNMTNSSTTMNHSSLVNNNSESGTTNVDEFAKEMKYLHDNGFTVLPLTSLKYNKDGNYFYLNYNVDNKNNKLSSGT